MKHIYGQALKKARKNAHLTQKELADKAGIALSSIRLYESGDRVPRHDGYDRILIALGAQKKENGVLEFDGTPDFMTAMILSGAEVKIVEPSLKEQLTENFDSMSDTGKELAVEIINVLSKRYKKG